MTDETKPEEIQNSDPAPTTDDEKHVGPMEILAAVLVFVVLVGGIGWGWYKGFQTGTETGFSEAYDDIYPQLRKGAQAITRQEKEQRFFVVLQEGQSVKVVLEKDGKTAETREVKAVAGDRVVISVSEQFATTRGQ